MKEYHQTPRKEQQHSRSSEIANRRSKETSSIISEQAKKPRKLTNKSLNSEFTAVSEDIFSPTSKESEISPVSEVYDGVIHTENFTALLDPDRLDSPETLVVEVTPSSKLTTDQNEGSSHSVSHFGVVESDCLKMKSVEAEVVVVHVEQALVQIMNSTDIDHRTKKLVHTLINIVMADFNGLPEERNMLSEFVAAKSHIPFICFFLWIIIVSVVLFINTGVNSSSLSELPPT